MGQGWNAKEEDSAEVNGEETGNREGETGENQGHARGRHGFPNGRGNTCGPIKNRRMRSRMD